MVGLAQPMPKKVSRSQLDRQLDRARNQGNSIEFLNSTERMEESDAEGMCTLRKSESERLRERRTKKRNDPISSESEQGEFEIGVNLVQEEGNGLQVKKE
ncbi:unnamed protein product [Microthlaspi erraticum]|uniref:Uncharacterized protein n=1 Tax=Microthlaspi erraticum TaxID=1685480 RepID=A0A6D2KMI0_9BRAS|nr:unnamed protein product [Microthlaspi erraticum]